MIAYTPLYFKFYRYPFVQYKEKSWYKILYQPLKQNYYFTNSLTLAALPIRSLK